MPKVSIIIVSYNMAREIPRTVLSFLPPYQHGVNVEDVEIIVVENGSTSTIPESVRKTWPVQVRYFEIDNAPSSPAYALNFGVEKSTANIVCPVIDGARMASPGIIEKVLKIFKMEPNSIVATLGVHLGNKLQQKAVLDGYNQAFEDDLLNGISWPKDGYRLFEICALAGSAQASWFGPVAESNAPFLSKPTYNSLNGYDERFDIAGGGLVNLDFFKRLLETNQPYFMLLGEATFHQYHGGVTTSRSVSEVEEDGRTTWQRYAEQYYTLRGEEFKVTKKIPMLMGQLNKPALKLGIKGIKNIEASWNEKS